jgi:two-component system chemotaxis response regulator CheY
MATVMVVDDAAFMRLILRSILIEGGHEVIAEAANGLEAVQIYMKVRPELVTMDITMPEMDGVEAMKEIRKFDPAAKIVVCSAMGQKASVVEAMISGAKDFIVKPFQKERVLETVEKANQL